MKKCQTTKSCQGHSLRSRWGRILSGLFATATLLSFQPAQADTPNKAYYSAPGSWILERRIDQSQLPRNSNTRYVVAEFDEDGQPWVPAQLQGALQEIQRFQPRTVLLYVHGWHNDSSPQSEKPGGDMHDLDKLIHQMQDVGAGKTMAIYVGWRGEIKTSLVRWGTLENRRKVARTIGTSPAFQNFLAGVAQASKSANANTVFVGHSLGAALMENAAKGMLCSQLPETRLPHVFLLVNSAELSYQSKPNIDAINNHPRMQAQLQGTKLISPRVISVTSLGDKANEEINPLNSRLLMGKRGTATIGFDKSALTHFIVTTSSRRTSPSDINAAAREQFRISLRPALDPIFWAPNAEHTEILKYRLLPQANRSRAPGFWNIQIPAVLSGDHNDVYNPRILASSVSWLQIANPALSQLPDDLPELLSKLREALVESEASDEANSRLNPYRLQLINGAALRLPYNPRSIRILLDELATPSGIAATSSKLIKRYRVNLFAILKFAQSPQDGWSAENISQIRSLLNQPLIEAALDESGVEDNDSNLSAFKKFLRKQGCLESR